MKWFLELNDNPIDYRRPFIAYTEEDNGIKSSKRMYAISEIIRILEKQNYEQESIKQLSSDVLPVNTIKKVQTPNWTYITMLVEKKCWDIKYQTVSQNYYIGFPRLAVQFKITNTHPFKIISMRVVALKEKDIISNDTKLYAFPFPNVDQTSCKVCITFPQESYTEQRELEKVFKYFISAPFNEDYSIKMQNINVQNFASYLSTYENLEFDDNHLKPMEQTLYMF